MLSLDPQDLYREIVAAEKERDKHLTKVEDQVAQYHGPAWAANSQDYPENHGYEFASLVLPKMAYHNPEVSVTSRLYTLDAEAAAAVIEQGLSSWIRRSHFRKLSQQIALDEMFAFGATVVSRRGQYGVGPGATRIPWRWFGMDHLANHWEGEPRFYFRKWVIDKDDLKRMAEAAPPEEGWNKEEIDNLSEDAGTDDLGEAWKDAPKRKQCVIYDVYLCNHRLPESKGPDAGYNGTIVRLGVQRNADGPNAGIVGKPRPWWGHPKGPFTVFGVHAVPNSCWPLGPITANQGQIDALNERSRSIQKANRAYKKLVLVDAINTKLIEDLKNKPDLFVVPVQGLKKDGVIQYEIGGASPQQLEDYAMLRERLDRNSGMTDAQRGNVTGQGTAREVMIAADAATARMDYTAQQHADGCTAMLEKVAWYLLNDESIEFPLDREAVEALEEMDMPGIKVFRGGSFKSLKFEDLELSIDVFSMARVNEMMAQRRALEKTNLLAQLAPVMASTPWVNWQKAMQSLGNAMNDPTYADILDVEKLSQGQDMVKQMAMQGDAGA